MPDILTPITPRESSASRSTLVCALVCTGAAAWLSQGTIAFTGSGNARVALLPLSATSAAASALAAAAVFAAWRAGASLAPLWLLGLLVLPWFSSPLPGALLVWSGPLSLVVWLAVALSLAASARLRIPPVPRPQLTAGVLACAIYGVAAWQVSPSIPAGDEPHYLIITQSLLEDGDLRIENNHARGDYRAYFQGELPKPDYRRLGRDRQIYSIHAPGLPALVAPAFAAAGYPGVVVFLVLLASLGSALAWRLASVVTGGTDAAWFGWAAVTLPVTAIFHSFTVYPDGPGGVIGLTGVWALLRAEREAETGAEQMGPWWLHGAALALLPWLHTRFALVAGCLGSLVLLRLAATRNAAGKAVAFLAIPAVSALCWVGYFIAIYGTPDPSVPYANEAGSASFIPGGLAGLFFDQRFGVLAHAPVLAFAVIGLGAMLADRARRRLGLELLFVLIPYLLAVTHFAMWWGGASAPGRFFVPMLPMMAIPSAVCWTSIRHRATRVAAIGSLALTVFASCALVFVGDGRLAYNVREGYAVWLEWLNGAASLALGLPAWWRGSEAALFREIAIWVAAAGTAWAGVRAVEGTRWLRTRGGLSTAAALAYAAAAMGALTVVWTLAKVPGTNPPSRQLEVLRRISAERRVLTFELPTFRPIAAADVPAMLRIEPAPSTSPGGAGPNDRPLYQVPSVPAGQYRLQPRGAGASGWLMIGIGRDQFSIHTGPLSTPPAPIVLTFPVTVRAIVVRGDEQARRSVRGLTIEPLSVVPPGGRLTREYARHAVRYGNATAFFLDDRSFPEPEAFWVGGSRSSSVVLQPDAAGPEVQLLVRNAPVDNLVVLQAGDWRQEMQLGPGEERRVQVPIDTRRGATLLTITTSAGFRPSAVDPQSRDARFLGVWVKILE
jgi:hypothetical protein